MAQKELTIPIAKRDRHGEVVSVAVSAEVQAEIHAWIEAHSADLDERLGGFGLGRYDIVSVDWRRIVREDEEL